MPFALANQVSLALLVSRVQAPHKRRRKAAVTASAKIHSAMTQQSPVIHSPSVSPPPGSGGAAAAAAATTTQHPRLKEAGAAILNRYNADPTAGGKQGTALHSWACGVASGWIIESSVWDLRPDLIAQKFLELRNQTKKPTPAPKASIPKPTPSGTLLAELSQLHTAQASAARRSKLPILIPSSLFSVLTVDFDTRCSPVGYNSDQDCVWRRHDDEGSLQSFVRAGGRAAGVLSGRAGAGKCNEQIHRNRSSHLPSWRGDDVGSAHDRQDNQRRPAAAQRVQGQHRTFTSARRPNVTPSRPDAFFFLFVVFRIFSRM